MAGGSLRADDSITVSAWWREDLGIDVFEERSAEREDKDERSDCRVSREVSIAVR
jgi:hypothetical protein